MGGAASADLAPHVDEGELHDLVLDKYEELRKEADMAALPVDIPGSNFRECCKFNIADHSDPALQRAYQEISDAIHHKLKSYEVPELESPIKLIMDFLDTAVYQFERWPVVVDPSGQGARFLRYQRGTMLLSQSPFDMQPETLRKSLVGALGNGAFLTINFDDAEKVELEDYFDPASFPREVLKKSDLFKEDVYSKLLQQDQGDPALESFQVKDDFKFVLVTKNAEQGKALAEKYNLAVVHVLDPNDPNKNRGPARPGRDAGADEIAAAFGARDVKRNSPKLVEAAFDGEWADIQEYIDQGYSIESEDPHLHTPLSEAACQGHTEICRKLIELGANPNAQNDTGRTSLYRASYNGHLETVKLLLDHGADPRLCAGLEGPYDVAKTDEVRELLDAWDVAETEKILERRKREEEKRIEERLTTAAERDAYAREKIRQELVALATEGKVKELDERLQEIADEALMHEERPRGFAEVRDDRGNTLLLIAVWKGNYDLVELLLTKFESFDPELDKVERKVYYSNINARDAKGWNACSLATFHGHKKILQYLLDHNGNPYVKNSYNKTSFDLASDDLDAARKVLVDRSEIRSVLMEWEKLQHPRQAAKRDKELEEAQKAAEPAASAEANAEDGGGEKKKKKPAANPAKKKPAGGAKGKGKK